MAPDDQPSIQSELAQSPSSQGESNPRRVSRRAVLALGGTAATSTLAGCNVLHSNSSSKPFHDGDWRSYGNGPANANRIASGMPEPTAQTVLASGDWPYAPPVVHEDVVYFAAGREVVAVTPDGNEQWSRRLDTEVCGAPALDPSRDRLYVPTRVVQTSNGPDPTPAFVTVLSLSDGEIKHTFRVGDNRTYGVSLAEGDIYVRSATACVKLAPDGTEQWRQPLDPLIYDEYNLGDSTGTQITPAVTEDGVYVPDRNAVVKLDPGTGDERWRVTVDTAYAASVIDDAGVIQTGHQETVAVNHAGEVRWRRDLHSRGAAAVAANGDIYVIAGDLHELDAATGETNWQAHLPSEGTAAPVVTEKSVLAVSGDVRAFRRDTGGILAPDRKRWEFTAVHAAAYSSPVIAAGRTYVVGPMGLIALASEKSE
jgi:outer membrane protein assembly factor BamB